MTQPYKNNNLRTAVKRVLNLEQYTDKVPSDIEDNIQLTAEVNPFMNVVCDIVASNVCINAGTATIYTTPTDKDFYLVAAALTVIKDVTATSLRSSIGITINSVSVNILTLAGLTLTVQSGQVSISSPYPIKVDRGTTITVANNTAVGNVTSSGNIIGFTIDSNTYDMGIGAKI